MTERSVHEAAVEAMAGALDEVLTLDSFEHTPSEDFASEMLDALVASAEVREGLVAASDAALDRAVCEQDCYRHRHGAAVALDAVLAALAGTEAT